MDDQDATTLAARIFNDLFNSMRDDISDATHGNYTSDILAWRLHDIWITRIAELLKTSEGCDQVSPGVWRHLIVHPADDCLSFRCQCGWLRVTDNR